MKLRLTPKQKKIAHALAWALLGSMVGASCAFLPEQYHGVCHLVAKLLGGAG